MKMVKTGFALDIDDTVADTAVACVETVGQRFGFPQYKSALELTAIYHQPGAVTEWQVPEIQTFISQTLQSPRWLARVPTVPTSVEVLSRLTAHVPISCYITSRLSELEPITETWLKMHGFPLAPVITRQLGQTRPDWKLEHLAQNYPRSYGLIDNELGFLPRSPTSYQGRKIWFNRYQELTSHSDLVHFSAWPQLEEILLQLG